MTQAKYYIWICENCKKQLSEDFMGNQCSCGKWTYDHKCKKEVVDYIK